MVTINLVEKRMPRNGTRSEFARGGRVLCGGRVLPGVLSAALAFAGLWVWVGCGDDSKEKVKVPEGCNPLAANWDCLLPYPSDFFLVDDLDMPGGKRVSLPETAVPLTTEDVRVDVTQIHPVDGFSHLSQIIALFPFRIDDSNLVFHTDDITASVGPDSPTVLMEADTGERVLHFAEVDPRAEDDTRRTLIIRPLVRLKNGTRYIVAVRRLQQVGGAPVDPGEGFELLRDTRADNHAVLGGMVAHYEENIFTPLENAGVSRAELQLAWDFTTATEECVTRDMVRVRGLAMNSFESTPPAVTVDEVDDDVSDYIFRRIRGTLTVPLYLQGDRAGSLLNRDGNGEVTPNGTAEAAFTVLIPRSVADASPMQPARLLQYCHGFFGNQKELEAELITPFFDRAGLVVIGVDWWGMSSRDLATVIEDIYLHTSNVLRFTDRVHQAMANQIAVTYAARSTLMAVPEMRINGVLVYNPDEIYMYGISQGHILGSTYLALTPHIERGVLSVGGSGFSMMMMRSVNFGEFLTLIQQVLPDYVDHQKFVTMSQSSFDRVDSITYSPMVIQRLYPGSPPQRRVLMHVGIGDPQVPNLASHLQARTLGLTLLTPSPRTVPALPAADGPLESAMVEFDFHVPEPLPGTYAIPPDTRNEVHEAVRVLQAAMDQIDAFLRPTGVIQNFCDGACDPE